MHTKLPNLIIGGVYKTGTTSLFSYLSSHTQIFGSPKKEIHYFTPLIFGRQLEPLSKYSNYFKNSNNQKYLLEASPGYMFGDESFIKNLFETLGENTKIIFLLRNPTKRFVSYYNHMHNKFLMPEISFDEFLSRSYSSIVNDETYDSNNVFSLAIREGTYANYLKPWLKNYSPNIKIIFFENLIDDTSNTLIELSNWLKIDPKEYERSSFYVSNKTVYHKNKFIFSFIRKFNMRNEGFFRKNYKLKRILKHLYLFFFSKKQNPKISISENSINRLDEIYKERNVELGKLLRKYKYKNLPVWLKNN